MKRAWSTARIVLALPFLALGAALIAVGILPPPGPPRDAVRHVGPAAGDGPLAEAPMMPLKEALEVVEDMQQKRVEGLRKLKWTSSRERVAWAREEEALRSVLAAAQENHAAKLVTDVNAAIVASRAAEAQWLQETLRDPKRHYFLPSGVLVDEFAVSEPCGHCQRPLSEHMQRPKEPTP